MEEDWDLEDPGSQEGDSGTDGDYTEEEEGNQETQKQA